MSTQTPVLIVGAGPSGLVLALCLTRQGIPVRIIDKNSGPGQASRAMAVHARTLEFYRQLGFADEFVARGIKVETASMRRKQKQVVKLELKNMGGDLSPFPFVLSLPQDEHERFLTDKLAAAGVKVDWGIELKSLTQDDKGVNAVLVKAGAEETVRAAYLCGCDGARSAVRRELDIGFPGGTYDHIFYVADAKLDRQPATDITANLDDNEFALLLPVRTTGMHRVIGIVPPGVDKETPTFEDVRQHAEGLLGAKVTAVNWFSTYHVHHRVADHFRKGRCFLAGDAGHIHSPFGGQGMNTGIGDAVNLSWKLADVIKGRAATSLLDSYEPERIGFARTLVASTDRAFQGLISGGLKGKFIRAWLLPHILSLATGFSFLRRQAFKTLSQTRISYHNSALSDGKAGSLEGGDRLPWTPGTASDNFKPLQSFDWQLHIYGDVKPALAQAAEKLSLPVHRLPADEASKKAGFKTNAAYLVRPDGYIALAFADQSAKKLSTYVEKHGLKFGSTPAPAAKMPAPPSP